MGELHFFNPNFFDFPLKLFTEQYHKCYFCVLTKKAVITINYVFTKK